MTKREHKYTKYRPKKLLDLFSGIGGFSLAASWVGIKTIGFVEIDKFCQKVLRKHWSGVPIYEDITKISFADCQSNGLEVGRVAQQKQTGQSDGNSKISDGRRIIRIPPVDIVSGGFPCQPFSCAGKRKGKADDRYLWPEMLRVISEVRPRWVIGENVAGFINMGLDDCISDLEGLQYEVQAFVIPACAVNAPHRRDRVWIVANLFSDSEGSAYRRDCRGSNGNRENQNIIERCEMGSNPRNCRQDVADAEGRTIGTRLCESRQTEIGGGRSGDGGGKDAVCKSISRGCCGESWRGAREESADGCWWSTEPDVGRVAHGISSRVDRLKSLGNAIVPQVAFQIFKAIMEVENT